MKGPSPSDGDKGHKNLGCATTAQQDQHQLTKTATQQLATLKEGQMIFGPVTTSLFGSRRRETGVDSVFFF